MAANPPNTHDPAHNNQENINNNLTCSSWFELDIKGETSMPGAQTAPVSNFCPLLVTYPRKS